MQFWIWRYVPTIKCMNFLGEGFEGFFVTIFITILVTIFITGILPRKRAPDISSVDCRLILCAWCTCPLANQRPRPIKRPTYKPSLPRRRSMVPWTCGPVRSMIYDSISWQFSEGHLVFFVCFVVIETGFGLDVWFSAEKKSWRSTGFVELAAVSIINYHFNC